MSLQEYRRKRNFSVTPEPAPKSGKSAGAAGAPRFVIQQHAASRLHFDFRLELGGALVSWAVPKGLPLKQGEKRLAVRTEDHPLSYYDFEGTIPKGEYGGGTVQVWDTGTFVPEGKAPLKQLEGGKLHFTLTGSKLSGEWYLVRLREENQWLIIRGGGDHKKLTAKQMNTSSLSGRTLAQIAAGKAVDTPKAAVKKTARTPPRKSAAKETPPDIDFIEPMKAKLVESPPAGDWGYELKFDGYRALAYLKGGTAGLVSRTNHSMTDKYPDIVKSLSGLEVKDAIIDGEIVALDEKGRSSFQLLQSYDLGQTKAALYYYVFDLIRLNGKNLTRLPLEERKEKLSALLPGDDGRIRYSSLLGGQVEALLKMARKHSLEGLIGKRLGSLYEAGRRSGAWIKLKLLNEQEFVIGGYTDPTGSRPYIGALLSGVYEKGKLVFAGKVGTGFTDATLRDLHAKLEGISQEECPFVDLPVKTAGRYGQGITPAMMKKCHWVQPELVAQVKFTEWTRDGRLRHPVFMGLRTDKPAKKVVREIPA